MKSRTFEIAKKTLYLSSFLIVVLVGITGLSVIGANPEHHAVAVLLVAGVVGFWLPLASIALLTMAFNEPEANGSTAEISARRIGEWLVIFFCLFVAAFTTFQNWSMLLRMTNGIYPNLVLETASAPALLLIAYIAGFCIYFRVPWAKYCLLILSVLLLLKSELWSQIARFPENILVGAFMVGYKAFPTTLALASSLSDLWNVGCESTAAVHFSPSF